MMRKTVKVKLADKTIVEARTEPWLVKEYPGGKSTATVVIDGVAHYATKLRGQRFYRLVKKAS